MMEFWKGLEGSQYFKVKLGDALGIGMHFPVVNEIFLIYNISVV